MTGALSLGGFELALASGFRLVAPSLSLALFLGTVRPLPWAAFRSCVQLLALGLVLRWVSRLHRPWVVLDILPVMMLFGAQTLPARVKRPPGGSSSAAWGRSPSRGST